MTSNISKKQKYIYPNSLVNRFNVSTIDKIWSLDDTKISFKNNKKYLSILFVIDLGSRKVIKYLFTKEDFNASHIKRAIKNLLISRNISDQVDINNRLIIHTDRDTHFMSKTWLSLQNEEKQKISLSMSAQGNPTENAVSERFHRTIKNFIIKSPNKNYYNKKLIDVIGDLEYKNCSTKKLTNIIKIYVDTFNNDSVHKHLNTTPNFFDQACIETKDIAPEPVVIAARNNNTSTIEDRIAVSQHKQLVMKLFSQMHDLFEDTELSSKNKILLKKAQQIVQLENKKLATLSQAQFSVVSEKLEEIQFALDNMQKQTQKQKKQSVLLPLRDPVLGKLFMQIITAPFFHKDCRIMVSYAQFKIAFLLLYITGARINEIKGLTFQDFEKIPKNHSIPILSTKTNTVRTAYIGVDSLELFKYIEDELNLIFKFYNFKSLGCSFKDRENVMQNSSWIRNFNKVFSYFKKEYNIELYLTSHSCRIGFITRLLSQTDIRKTAEIVGHKSLQSTERYNRYKLSGTEQKRLTDSIISIDVDDF